MERKPLPEDLTGKKILLAGAAGFVPGHFAEFYLNKGAQVYGLDNFVTGDRRTVNILEKYDNFRFEEKDVCSDEKFFSNVQFDYVCHLASPASPIDFPLIPLEIMQVNSVGAHRLLERARIDNALYFEASTSEVYGDPEVHPQVESYLGHVNPIGPRSCYDESKRFAEAMTMVYNRKYNLNTRIVRIFNTYGPRMRPDDGRVIPNFINQSLRGEDLTVYGDGSQTRSFCYVSDLILAMNIVIFRGDHMPYNIGSPQEHSILETAKLINSALNGKSQITFKELPADDPKKRKPNISRVLDLGLDENQVPFSEGIQKTAQYFKSIL